VRANSVQISYLSVLLLPAIVAWQKGLDALGLFRTAGAHFRPKNDSRVPLRGPWQPKVWSRYPSNGFSD